MALHSQIARSKNSQAHGSSGSGRKTPRAMKDIDTYNLVSLRKVDPAQVASVGGNSPHEVFIRRRLPWIDFKVDAPDQTWIAESENEISGHFSVWYSKVPQLSGHKVGYIGHFYAANSIVASHVLNKACKLLEEEGCQQVVGPIDGNTWRKYRLVIESDGTPPFLLEPINPPQFAEYFETAGFKIVAKFRSAMVDVKEHFDKDADEIQARLKEAGVTVRTINLRDFDAELTKIHATACDSFKGNFLYSPISLDEFLTRYRATLPMVHPELILIAERDQQPVGFVFALPHGPRGGSEPNTLVLKTLARVDDPSLKGLGRLLVHTCHKNAARQGYKKMIHALYKEDNVSSTYSEYTEAKIIRRYALFAKSLDPSSRESKESGHRNPITR